MTKEIWPVQRVVDWLKTHAKLPETAYCTVNFSWNELLVNQDEKPSETVIRNLQAICFVLQKYRNTVFKQAAITITSGWRSEKYNATIPGSAKHSCHIEGKALDFVVNGFTPQEVQKMLDPIHKGGMEYAKTWTHIDNGTQRRFKP